MLAVALLGLVMGTQTGTQTGTQPPDESSLQESERRIPPGHYCKRADVPISKSERSPVASQYAACFIMSFIDPVTERFNAVAKRTVPLAR
jgi:hypothetical protein